LEASLFLEWRSLFLYWPVDVVPRLDNEARRELFDVLTSVLQYLQEHEARRANAEFKSLEGGAARNIQPITRSRSKIASGSLNDALLTFGLTG
jgi:hypothetical protein